MYIWNITTYQEEKVIENVKIVFVNWTATNCCF